MTPPHPELFEAELTRDDYADIVAQARVPSGGGCCDGYLRVKRDDRGWRLDSTIPLIRWT